MPAREARQRHPIAGSRAEPIHVLVVDDSAVIRGVFNRVLDAEPGIEVVASVGDGLQALTAVERHRVDVVLLDIEMPVMDGMTALPRILAASPKTKVIMASTLTRRNADVSLKALAKGAADYIAKPSSMSASQTFTAELVAKVKALAEVREKPFTAARQTARAGTPAAARPRRPGAPIPLRSPSLVSPKVIAVASSTGGPQALFKLLAGLKTGLRVPILVTQHMPATFTTILAEHIARVTGLPAAEGKDGTPIAGGRIYLAPGDYHMEVRPDGRHLRLHQGARENFCRPSADVMLRSLARAFGPAVLTVILTGMGHDGLAGARVLTEAGATVIAQDEETSVVWGMPGAVAAAGLCSAVLPLPQIAGHVVRLLGGGGR